MSHRDLFQAVVQPPINGRSTRYTVALSIVAHATIVAVLFIVPLMAADILPVPRAMLAFVASPVLPPPPPPLSPPRLPSPERQAAALSNPDAAPLDAPLGITAETALTFAPAIEDESAAAGVPGITGGLTEVVETAPPPPPPVPTMRVGGRIQRPEKVRHVNPAYPPIAQAARVEGIVIIEATIAPDGHVQETRILRSIPLLDQAALEAVAQWEFTPTRLNGVPVAVVMTVTVNFKLQ